MSFCGTPEVYCKTLRLFRDQIPGKLRQIRGDFETDSWSDYIIEVHSLKSGARWIGAMTLGDQAERLEMAARAGELDQVREETPLLLTAYQALQATLAGADLAER